MPVSRHVYGTPTKFARTSEGGLISEGRRAPEELVAQYLTAGWPLQVLRRCVRPRNISASGPSTLIIPEVEADTRLKMQDAGSKKPHIAGVGLSRGRDTRQVHLSTSRGNFGAKVVEFV